MAPAQVNIGYPVSMAGISLHYYTTRVTYNQYQILGFGITPLPFIIATKASILLSDRS